MGCYIDKVRDIEHLFQLVEDIAWLKKCKVISNLSITQIFLLLHRRPEIIRELLRLFDAFKHKEGCDMIKSLEDLFTKHTTKE